MKLAILGESPADEAALRILADSLLGAATRPPQMPSLRTRGWPSVLNILEPVIKDLHFHTDCEALVVVVDSDNSPIHLQEHENRQTAETECRVCLLSARASRVLSHLTSRPGRLPLKCAFGLAIPAVEAWYRCGIDPHATEAMLIPRLGAGARELKLKLKRDVYGTDRPSLEFELKRAVEEASRLSADIHDLEAFFPAGFGLLAHAIRCWQSS